MHAQAAKGVLAPASWRGANNLQHQFASCKKQTGSCHRKAFFCSSCKISSMHSSKASNFARKKLEWIFYFAAELSIDPRMYVSFRNLAIINLKKKLWFRKHYL
jgi:hypothetical protein